MNNTIYSSWADCNNNNGKLYIGKPCKKCGNTVRHKNGDCKTCRIKRPRTEKELDATKEKAKANYQTLDGRESSLYRNCKYRAKFENREFSISQDDIKIPKVCPLLGIKLILDCPNSSLHLAAPTLDRIDNNKGYISGNVAVISKLANTIFKRALSISELKELATLFLNIESADIGRNIIEYCKMVEPD